MHERQHHTFTLLKPAYRVLQLSMAAPAHRNSRAPVEMRAKLCSEYDMSWERTWGPGAAETVATAARSASSVVSAVFMDSCMAN